MLFIVTTNKPSCSQFTVILLFERVVMEREGTMFKRKEIVCRERQREEKKEENRTKETTQATYVQPNIVEHSHHHFAQETTTHSVCVVELHVTVNRIKIYTLVQKRFYGELMSQVTVQVILTNIGKKLYSN